jgi:2-haloacid dehalogenase
MIRFEDFSVLTFDCYGTLIDWEPGLLAALTPILDAHRISVSADEVLERYAELESAAEEGEYRSYRDVLRTVLTQIGSRLGFAPSADERERFSASVRDWPPFPDSPAALQALHRRYRLAIISNVDDDLFAASEARLQVKFDWVITAQQARSYKPSLNNFRLAFERIGVPPGTILHVAQSLFHDIGPANELGLASVWVNRRHGKPGAGATPPAHARPDLEVPDLAALARAAGVA